MTISEDIYRNEKTVTAMMDFSLSTTILVPSVDVSQSSQDIVWSSSEEVRHGDVTAGVKRAWNVITADKCRFFILRGILLPVFFNVCTSAGPAKFKLKYKSKQNPSTLTK